MDLDRLQSDTIVYPLVQLIGTTTRWAGNSRAHLTGADSTVTDTNRSCRSFSDVPLPMRTAVICVRPLSMEDLMVGKTAVINGHEKPPQALPTVTP